VTPPISNTPGAAAPEPSADDGPEVTIRTVTREEYDAVLAEHVGKVILVDYWATYCVPCLERFPFLVEFARKHADRGLVVVTMSCDDESRIETAREFLRKKRVDFIHLRSEHGAGEQTFVDYKIKGGALPHYKLYDRQGKIRWTLATGDMEPISREGLERYVVEMLNEKE
jgi:thiol-disulfide isomerase/thioredoxin